MRSDLFPGIESVFAGEPQYVERVENRVRRRPLGTRVAARAYHNRRLVPWTATSCCEDFTNQRRAEGTTVEHIRDLWTLHWMQSDCTCRDLVERFRARAARPVRRRTDR